MPIFIRKNGKTKSKKSYPPISYYLLPGTVPGESYHLLTTISPFFLLFLLLTMVPPFSLQAWLDTLVLSSYANIKMVLLHSHTGFDNNTYI